MKALKSDLHHRQRDRSCAEIPTAVLLAQDLSLLESFEQTVEAKENEPRAMDDFTTSQRWITIDKGMLTFQRPNFQGRDADSENGLRSRWVS